MQTYPCSSIKGTLLFRLLNAKHDFTRIPYAPVGKKKTVRNFEKVSWVNVIILTVLFVFFGWKGFLV